MSSLFTSSESSDSSDLRTEETNESYETLIARDIASESSESSVVPQNVGISYWQIFQWPNVFIVGWTPTESSLSSESSSESSSSSKTTGALANEYTASGFSVFAANGCYRKMGFWVNSYPVYSNGNYFLKHGDSHFPRWYLEDMDTLVVHYSSQTDVGPENEGNVYTPFLFWIGDGGTIVSGCIAGESSSSKSSKSSISSESEESQSSWSHLSASSKSSLSSYSDEFSEISFLSNSSHSSSSSSSYYENLPDQLPSYVSTCMGMNAVSNPATGATVGMTILGSFKELSYPEDNTFIYKGGIARTSANMGIITCPDASNLFSMRYGMVSITLRFPYAVSNGVYAPLSGKEDSANPDMVIFVVNNGEHYFSPPGLYAALTPSGIEFSTWSSGGKITLTDSITNISAETDVVLSFAWDYLRRMTYNETSISTAIFVNGVMTAFSSDPIVPNSLEHLFSFTGNIVSEDESESTEEWVAASFCLGDSKSGKNGLVDVVIRRIEIYKEPYGIPMKTTHDIAVLEPYSSTQRGEIELGFSVIGTRWFNVNVDEPVFRPSIAAQVNLLDVGTGLSYSEFGIDAGQNEDESYPEIPSGLPIGITEVRGRQDV